MATAVRSMLLCLVLLLSPCLCFSYHTSYTNGGMHFVLRSNSDPKQPQSLPCSSKQAGRSGSNGLPLMHRSHPCSGLGGDAETPDELSAEDVLHRDASRFASLFGEASASTSSAPAPAPSSSVHAKIPTIGDPKLGGSRLEYHVAAGFGTPVQNFTVGFDMGGATLLQCKPCANFPEPCNDSFDPSASSSLAQVPCGSPDCPLNSCSGPTCTRNFIVNGTFVGNVSVVTDTITLSPSTTLENLMFTCVEGGLRTIDSSSGILDLSRDSHSLASRAPSSFFTVAFAYCLPSSRNGVGFLSIGAPRPELFGYNVSYTPLRSDAAYEKLYFVELVGIRVGLNSLPIPRIALAGNTLLDVHMSFTYLPPAVYKVLRDTFRERMSEYRVAPPRGELDTCYDFTGLNITVMPIITLEFDGGASILLLTRQMMIFSDPNSVFSVGCLAFAPRPADRRAVSTIGNMAQASTEVVYDLRAGKVGFIRVRC